MHLWFPENDGNGRNSTMVMSLLDDGPQGAICTVLVKCSVVLCGCGCVCMGEVLRAQHSRQPHR